MPNINDILPDTLKPTPEYEELLVWDKGKIWHAGNAGVWLRFASTHPTPHTHVHVALSLTHAHRLPPFGSNSEMGAYEQGLS